MPLKNKLVRRGEVSPSRSFRFLELGDGIREGGVRPGKMFLYQQSSLACPAPVTARGYTHLQSERSWLSTRGGRASTFYTHEIYLQWSGGRNCLAHSCD